MSLKSQAASGVRWMSVQSAVGAILGLLQLAVLARKLSPDEFGLLAVVMIVMGLLQMFADLGTTNAVIQRQNITDDELSSLYWLRIFTGIAAFAIAALTAPFISAIYDSPLLNPMIIVMGGAFLIAPFGAQHQVLLQKRLGFGRMIPFELGALSAGAAVTIISAFSGQGVFSPVWGHLVATTVRALSFGAFSGLNWRPSFRISMKNLAGYRNFGLYQIGERILVYLLTNMDKILISRILGMEALGYYSVAYQIVMRPVSLINPVIMGVAFPVFSIIQDDLKRLKNASLKAVESVSFINAPLYLALFAAAESFIGVVLGSAWGSSVQLLRILLCLGLIYAVSDPIGSILLARGKAMATFWLNLLCLICYAVAIPVGSLWGLNGIAASLVLSQCLLFLAVELWMLHRGSGIRPVEYLNVSYPYIALSLFMALTMMGAASLFGFQGGPRLIAHILTGFAVYALGIIVFRRQAVGRMLNDLTAGTRA